MLISNAGVLIRTKVEQIREMSRATQGVTLINLDEGSLLAGLEKVAESDAVAEMAGDAEAGDADVAAPGEDAAGGTEGAEE
jgi:DNA gyrase subunit A